MIAIIGTGKMALAIAQGLQNMNLPFIIVGRKKEKLEEIAHRYHYTTAKLENFDLSQKSVILAIKPYALEDISKQVHGTADLLISILAGTSIAKLKTHLQSHAYIRAMPNIAAASQASTTAVTGDAKAKEKAISLLSAIGKAIWVETEKELDIATAIAGSGPAFLAIIAEAIADGGVLCGLSRERAEEFTRGLFTSFAALNALSFEEIKHNVMSPAGTTAAGVQQLEKHALRAAFIDAVEAAYKKTQKN